MASPDWSTLTHAYGAASDVPALLAAIDRGDRRALRDLATRVFHQDARYNATRHVVSELLDRVRTGSVLRADLLLRIAELCAAPISMSAGFAGRADGETTGCIAALVARLDDVLELLSTAPMPDRAAAAMCAGCAVGHAPHVADALLDRLAVEPSSTVRASIVMVLGDVEGERASRAIASAFEDDRSSLVRLVATMVATARAPSVEVVATLIDHLAADHSLDVQYARLPWHEHRVGAIADMLAAAPSEALASAVDPLVDALMEAEGSTAKRVAAALVHAASADEGPKVARALMRRPGLWALGGFAELLAAANLPADSAALAALAGERYTPDPIATAVFVAGVLADTIGDVGGANDVLERIRSDGARDARFWVAFGRVTADDDQALACFARGAALRDDLGEAWFELGRLLLETHRNVEAEPAVSRASELMPSHPEAAANHALALKRLGKLREHIDVLTSATARMPRAASLWESLGLSQHEAGAHAEAAAALDRAVDADPDRASAHYSRARVRVAAGDLDGASNDVLTALDRDPALRSTMARDEDLAPLRGLAAVASALK